MNVMPTLMGRTVGSCGVVTPFVGRCPTLVSDGPLALCHTAAWNGDSESANGAPPSQPGATPQVTERKRPKG